MVGVRSSTSARRPADHLPFVRTYSAFEGALHSLTQARGSCSSAGHLGLRVYAARLTATCPVSLRFRRPRARRGVRDPRRIEPGRRHLPGPSRWILADGSSPRRSLGTAVAGWYRRGGAERARDQDARSVPGPSPNHGHCVSGLQGFTSDLTTHVFRASLPAAFLGVSALLFAASAAGTIVWCASTCRRWSEMPMPVAGR